MIKTRASKAKAVSNLCSTTLRDFFESQIEESIKNDSQKGMFTSMVHIPKGLSQQSLEDVIKELELAGYSYKLTPANYLIVDWS